MSIKPRFFLGFVRVIIHFLLQNYAHRLFFKLFFCKCAWKQYFDFVTRKESNTIILILIILVEICLHLFTITFKLRDVLLKSIISNSRPVKIYFKSKYITQIALYHRQINPTDRLKTDINYIILIIIN